VTDVIDDGAPGTVRSRASGGVARRIGRVLAGFVVVLIVLIAAWWLYQAWPVALPPSRGELTLIAHRGVHHDFPMEGVEWDTCTAERIYPPTHDFIENTVPSIRAAFDAGASVVEIDLHVTRDGELAVFHDFMLECRTEATGDVADHTLAELQNLDVGYGYTADGGATFPLRGSGVGMMPSLDDVLTEFPDQRIMLDPKDERSVIAPVLTNQLSELAPRDRARISLWAERDYDAALDVPGVERLLAERGSDVMTCAKAYLRRLGIGALPTECGTAGIAIPAAYLNRIPGWPNRLLRQAHDAGVPIYVETDDADVARDVARLPISGILTDRIEQVGPALAASDRPVSTSTAP
jgi:glycerophosphoryl diester phosphodiesterase